MATNGDMKKSSSKASTVLSFLSITLCAFVVVRVEVLSYSLMRTNSRVDDFDQRLQTLERAVEEIQARKVDEFQSNEYKNRPLRRQTRNAASASLTIQQVRAEVTKQVNNVCNQRSQTCKAGSPGPPGPKGALGYPGYKGGKGNPGKLGPQGPTGKQGHPGTPGTRGKQGPVGIKGDTGEAGPVGPVGPKGDRGNVGPRGAMGPPGMPGGKGQPGPRGMPGLKGDSSIEIEVKIFPKTLSIEVNRTAEFYCWVNGLMTSLITWKKLGGALTSNTAVSGGSLKINRVQRRDSGWFMCKVQTPSGILQTVATLTILEPPRFISKPVSYIAVIGPKVKLCCTVEGSPTPTVEWSKVDGTLPAVPLDAFDGCLTVLNFREQDLGNYLCRATNRLGFVQATTKLLPPIPCDKHRKIHGSDGIYSVSTKGNSKYDVFCDMTSDNKGWTLVARFSNNDAKNWMKDNGEYWYDRQSPFGQTTNPTHNADMITPAFWSVKGTEFKITRSDDSSHTALLQTTSNCLSGHTFRSKLTSYGDFRNGKVWSSDKCLGSCDVQYGGQYSSTDGFEQAQCDGSIQSRNKIGFWCDYSGGDGAVMMIGGGGSSCSRADHGIGVTETNAASFVEIGGGETEYDFGYGADTSKTPSSSYSLNLWVR